MDFRTEDLTLKKILVYAFVALVGLLILKIFMLHLLPLGILLFLFLSPAVFVLADAQERGVHRPMAWAVFTLFTWVFGLMIYLLARPDQARGKAFCPHCGGETDPRFHNCPWCGKSMVQTAGKCPSCQTDLKPGWKYCPSCNAPVVPATGPAAGAQEGPPPAP